MSLISSFFNLLKNAGNKMYTILHLRTKNKIQDLLKVKSRKQSYDLTLLILSVLHLSLCTHVYRYYEESFDNHELNEVYVDTYKESTICIFQSHMKTKSKTACKKSNHRKKLFNAFVFCPNYQERENDM